MDHNLLLALVFSGLAAAAFLFARQAGRALAEERKLSPSKEDSKATIIAVAGPAVALVCVVLALVKFASWLRAIQIP